MRPAVVWEDKHSRYRRHKLMTKELGAKIPPLYANEHAEDPDGVIVHAKLFCPYTTGYGLGTSRSGTPRRERVSGMVDGFSTRAEIGYFDLTELSEVAVMRTRPRRGARPLLGAEDPRRGQERSAVSTGCSRGSAERRGHAED